MRKIYLLPFIALGLWSCNSNDPTVTNEDEGSVVNRYMTVNLVSSRGISSRATEPEYANGSAAENAVNRVRFFFFTADGKATPVWKNKGTGTGVATTYNSYLDWYPTSADEGPGNSNETVEKILNATLDLMLPENFKPAGVVAILNPTDDVLALNTQSTINVGAANISLNGPSLTELQSTVKDFRTGLMSMGNFVMSNSVYLDKNKSIISATVLEDSNFGTTLEEAQDNTVKIYVERVLARLDFSLDLTNEAKQVIPADGGESYTIYKLNSYKVYEDNTDNTTNIDIYVRLLGWNITGTPNVSNLIKDISATWEQSKLFGNEDPWNTDNYHRSFWAMNPNPVESGFEYLFGNFDGTTSTDVVANPEIPGFSPANSNLMPSAEPATIYLQENANQYSAEGEEAAPGYATKIIIAAQLVNEDGSKLELAEWAHSKYTLPQLLTKLCATSFNNLYKKTVANGTVTYTQIKESDITFATAYDLGLSEEDEAAYYVYPILSATGKAATWTLGNNPDSAELTIDQVNNYLRDAVNHVKVWNNGYTYYFFDIYHLGAEESPAYFGIVRNHLYIANLKSISGLGTPVYDPSETIYPEKTETDSSIVIAEIKILQWRVVSEDYNVTWE